MSYIMSDPDISKTRDSVQTKHFNTELLLQSFDKWHTSFQGVLKERNELREDIQAANQEMFRLADANQKTRNEFDALHSTVKDTNNQLDRICSLEEEIRQLKVRSEEKEHEIEKLKTQICEERRNHSREQEQARVELEEKLVKNTAKMKAEASIEHGLLQNQINDRERDLREAEDSLKRLQRSKDAELSRVSLEYESKLARLQRLKTQSNQNQLSSVNSDIFRKKLQNMKAEYESEVSRLKFTIANLEERLASTTTMQPLRQRQTLSTERRKRTF